MGLINLLTVGRSLSGVSHGGGHYKLASANLLPNFSAGRAVSRGAAAVLVVAAPAVTAPAKPSEPAPRKMPVANAPPSQEVAQPELKLAPAVAATERAASVVNVAANKTAPPLVTAPVTAAPRAQAKFTLGRWVRLMLNR